MVKHRIGQAKMANAMNRRLERGRAKMQAKRNRHRNCEVHMRTGKHDLTHDIDGSLHCNNCLRFARYRWF